MSRSMSRTSGFRAGMLFLAMVLLPQLYTAKAESGSDAPVFSPVVNGSALRGLSTIGSAESIGEGRITFDVIAPWYHQRTGYPNTPVAGANIFTGTGAQGSLPFPQSAYLCMGGQASIIGGTDPLWFTPSVHFRTSLPDECDGGNRHFTFSGPVKQQSCCARALSQCTSRPTRPSSPSIRSPTSTSSV